MTDTTINTTLTDADGQRWHFAYTGGSFIRIRRHTGDLIDTQTPNWEYSIQLDYYGMKPDQITMAWFDERAAEWITDRNNDLATGNL